MIHPYVQLKQLRYCQFIFCALLVLLVSLQYGKYVSYTKNNKEIAGKGDEGGYHSGAGGQYHQQSRIY